MPRRRKIILVNLLILVLLLALTEISVRLFTSCNMPFDERQRASIQYQPHGLYRFQPVPSQVVLHGNQGQLTDTVSYTLDEMGFRKGSMAKGKSPYRVAILGGSHVFDVNALEGMGNLGWPAHCAPPAGSFQVLNAGVPGSDTRDYPARILHQLRAYHPQHILLLSAWNDLKWIHAYPASGTLDSPPRALQPDPLVSPVNRWDRLLGWSALYRKLRDAYWRRGRHIDNELAESTASTPEHVNLGEGLAQYEANLELCIAAAKAIGAEVTLVRESRLAVPGLPPQHHAKIKLRLLEGISSVDELVKAYAECDSVLALVAARHNLRLVEEGVSGDNCPECFADHTHYTPAGSLKNAAALRADSLWLYPHPLHWPGGVSEWTMPEPPLSAPSQH